MYANIVGDIFGNTIEQHVNVNMINCFSIHGYRKEMYRCQLYLLSYEMILLEEASIVTVVRVH